MVTVILGAQWGMSCLLFLVAALSKTALQNRDGKYSNPNPWCLVGDEGKGKLSDILCQKAQVCARAAGGHNAGHSVV